MNEPSTAPVRRSPLPLIAFPLAVLLALVPLASLRALGAPTWLWILGALTVFPLLPLGWHMLAESPAPPLRPRTPMDRLALRALLVGLLVLAVALSALGPAKSGGVLMSLLPGRAPKARKVTPSVPTAPAGPKRHELESFIPADARMVLALSGSQVMENLIAAHHADTRDRLTALAKCGMSFDGALLLIAAREPGTRLIVVRAPGITDVRNLYCLIGVLGSSHVTLKFTSDKSPIKFDIEGLLATTLHFTAVDDHTLVMAEGSWSAGGTKKLFTDHDTIEGPLATPLQRLDRTASLWAASVTGPESDVWDLALHGHLDGTHLRLHASATPPSGPNDRADLDLTAPSAFVSALPRQALERGLAGTFAVLTAGVSGAAH